MEAGIIRVTDKGQVSIPRKIQRAAGIRIGDELLMVFEEGTIVIRKTGRDAFRELLQRSERVARKVWGTRKEDGWDTV